jgi:uncharacterized phage protein (TIGR01671 family)
MTREIKFRIWDDTLSVLYTPEKNDKEKNLWKLPEMNGGRLVVNDDIKVMQFTGLKDKNEKEIYEGDIIRFYFSADDPDFPDPSQTEMIDTVEYFNGCFYFREQETKLVALAYRWNDRCEIIGNIHENPELL